MNDKSVQRATTQLKEALREIHMTAGLDEPSPDGAPRSLAIGVTSPRSGDGKTTVAMALASSLITDFEAEVVLVDADLHSHSMGREYGLESSDGLTEVLAGTTTLEAIRHHMPVQGMSVISAGRGTGDPSGLARSERLVSLLEAVKSNSQYVILDLPPTLNSMTAPIVAKRTDGVVVVVRAGETSVVELERTLSLLRGARILGVIINRSKSRIPAFVERALNLHG